MSNPRWLHRFLVWRIKHINNNDFTLILSAIVGTLAGLAAVSLKESVHFIQHLLQEGIHMKGLKLFYPLIGILLTVLISRYWWKDRLGHGVSDVLLSIAQKSSKMLRSRTYSRWLTSLFTVGFGGSVGLEAPIVVTGSAIGSNFGKVMHLDYKRRTILIGCGAAGAISGIFNSPISGVIFSSEVILAGASFATFIPLLIAAVCGSLVSLTLSGSDVLFSFELTESFYAAETPYFILLGIFSGLLSIYFIRVNYYVEYKIKKVKNYLLRGTIGGLMLALVVFIFPPIYGEGYGTIKQLLNSSHEVFLNTGFFSLENSYLFILWAFLFGILLIKPVATALTIGSGGSGGIFAPSLFLGAILGALFASIANYIPAGPELSISNFALVGMCGIMSGVLSAPLTGIFLIAEITGGYTLFVPLMIVSAISTMTTSYFEKYSFYTKKLIERNQYSPHDQDKQLLDQIKINKIIEKDLMTIEPDKTMSDLIKLVRKSKRNIFPVVDTENKFQGIITLDDIRDIMFDSDKYDQITIASIMHKAPAEIYVGESMREVMSKFEKTGAWNLPVIQNGQYAGFVSKSRIFNTYRSKLLQFKLD